MRKASPVLLLALLILLLPMVPPLKTSLTFAQSEKPPLTIEFVVDPELTKGLTKKDIEKRLQEAVKQASSIFLAQAGRRLETVKITFDVQLPKNINKPSLFSLEVFKWLEELSKTTDFMVFITNKEVKDAAGESKGGFANMKIIDSVYVKSEESIILYNDTKLMRSVLLHELGHNCTAKHVDEDKTIPDSEKIESIMHSKITSDLRYDSKSLDAIKQNCG